MSGAAVFTPREKMENPAVKIFFDIRREYRFANAGLAIVFFTLLIAPFFLYVPESTTEKSLRFIKLPQCTIKTITGRPCPSCGLTRSIVVLYQGKIGMSQDFHPAGYLVVIWLIIELLFRVRFFWTRTKWWFPWVDISQLILSGIAFKITISAFLL